MDVSCYVSGIGRFRGRSSVLHRYLAVHTPDNAQYVHSEILVPYPRGTTRSASAVPADSVKLCSPAVWGLTRHFGPSNHRPRALVSWARQTPMLRPMATRKTDSGVRQVMVRGTSWWPGIEKTRGHDPISANSSPYSPLGENPCSSDMSAHARPGVCVRTVVVEQGSFRSRDGDFARA